MKLNKLLSIIISSVIAFTASFTFHSSFEDTTSFTAAAADDTEQTYDSWQEAYRAKLIDFMYNDKYNDSGVQASAFDIIDIDSNGIPELIISEGNFQIASCYVYTFSNSKCNESLNVSNTNGVLYIDEAQKYVVYKNSYMGYNYMSIFICKENSIDVVVSFSDNLMNADYETVKCKINDNIVSEENYKSEISKYDNLTLKSVGRTYSFDELYYQYNNIYYRFYFDYYEAYYADTSSTTLSIANTVNGLPVTCIGSDLLTDSTSVTNLNIPANITTFYFYGLNGASLTSINVNSDNPYYTSQYGVMYNKDMTELVKFPTAKNVSAFSFPQSVTSIGRYAFAWCTGVKTITIPENIDSIYDHAFYLCPNLSSVTVENVCCDFWDNWDDYKGYTICNTYDKTSDSYNYLGVIRGYDYSYAQDYAEYFGRTFISLGSASTTTTTTTTSTTISTTTTTTTSSTPIESVKLGDVNDDNKITPVDASLTLLTYAKKQTQSDSNAGFEGLTSSQIAAADVNKDNRITPVDASLILGYYSYLQTDNNFGNYMTMEEYLNHS